MNLTAVRTLAVAGSAALALTLAGCGGDDSLTAKEFRTQAEKLCTEAEKDTEALGEGLSETSSDAEVETAIDGLVERTEKLAKDIGALEPPEDLQDGVDELVASIRAAIKKIDDASVEELGEMEDPFAEANEKAEELDLDACGE